MFFFQPPSVNLRKRTWLATENHPIFHKRYPPWNEQFAPKNGWVGIRSFPIGEVSFRESGKLFHAKSHQKHPRWWPKLLGGGFKDFLFSPLPGEMIQFDEYFSNGLKPPTRLGGNSKIFWTFTLWGSNLTELNDELNDLFRIPTDPIPYLGGPRKRPLNSHSLFWKRPWNFSRDLFHQQFHGPIILVMFSLSGISCMTRKRDFYRLPPVRTMICRSRERLWWWAKFPAPAMYRGPFCWCGKFLWGGKTGVITWHTLGSPIYKPRKGHLEGVPQPLLEAY